MHVRRTLAVLLGATMALPVGMQGAGAASSVQASGVVKMPRVVSRESTGQDVLVARRAVARLRAARMVATPAVTLVWHKKYVNVRWTKPALDTQRYTVEVSKQKYYGPFRGWYTRKNHVHIKYTDFPYRGDKKMSGYMIRVWAEDAFGNVGKPQIGRMKMAPKVKPVVIKKRTPYRKMVPKLVRTCTSKGLAASTGVAAGGATLAGIAAFVPPVEAPTVAGVLAAAAAGGVGTTVACVVWKH